jgi:hypothetical protein
MDIIFATATMEDAANSTSQLDDLFGADAERIKQRLCELAAADNLAVARSVPTLRLSRAASGSGFTVYVSSRRRLVLEPVIPSSARGKHVGADDTLHLITAVRILSID